jgi:hypothetical protein
VESFEIEEFFTRVETGLLTRGLLRADGGGPDVPFTDEMLARNFMALAFSQEFSGIGGRLVRERSDAVLYRWVEPVRIQPHFGTSVAQSRADRDRGEIVRLARRLEETTRHPVNVVDKGGNLHVLVLNDQELRLSPPLLKELMPEITRAELDYVREMPRETYCVVIGSDPSRKGVYARAVAVIRAELPTALRTSCLHEEIAQGLGLADDSPQARPSIFNDDDEFGRLTTQDELLLRMLYDSRLTPGMTAADAAPMVRRLATEYMSPAT